MAEQVVVALKITTDAQTGGIKITTGALQDMAAAAGRANGQWDQLGNTIAKKFSAADIGKSVLGGLGLGSGFAVAQQAASLIVGYWQRAAEHAKYIADQSDRQLEAVRRRIQLEQTPVQQLATMRAEQAKGERDLGDLTAQKYTIRAVGGTVRGEDMRRTVKEAREHTAKELQDIANITAANKERANAIVELEQQIKAAADAERALLSEDEKHAQALKKINDQVGSGGLTRAEADARIAQLNREREERTSQEQADRLAAQLDEDQRAADAQKKLNELFDQSAEKYRQLADPQREYQQQLAEIDRLMNTVAATGQPFLTAQEGAAAKARILAEVNDTAGQAIRATREEVERYDLALAALDANPALSDQEKQRERIRLIDAQTAAIHRAREALAAFRLANPGVDTAAITEALNRFGDQSARNARATQPAQTLAQRDAINLRDLTDPAKHYQDAGTAAQGGASQFLVQLGTQADTVADMLNNGLNSALGETSNFLFNLGTGAMSFREAWDGAILAVGQNFARMASDMVAKLLWRATVDRALTALGVTTHLGGEAAKTAGTGMGVAKRLALVAKEALADVYHGAVAAFKALAGIPIIGPVLGAAALAGALALGVGLVSKIGGHAGGGIVAGGRQLSWLNEEGTEAVIRAPSVRKFGAPFLADLNDGILNLEALPGGIAGQLPAAADQVALAGAAGSSPDAGGGSAMPPQIVVLADPAEFARAMQENSKAYFFDLMGQFQRKNG